MSVRTRPGSPYYWYSFTLDGRRFRGSTKETNERRARIVEAELIAKLRASGVPPSGWRLRDCLGTYWQDHAKSLRSGDQIFRIFERLSDALGADLPIRDLTNAMLLDYRARRRAGQKNGSGWRTVAAHTVNRDFAWLRAALSHARDMHGQPIPSIAWKRLRMAEPEHRIRFASAGEFEDLLAAAHESIRPILIAAVTTGLRRGNLLALEWHQVDLDGGTITIARTKGRKPITVRVTGVLRAALAATPRERRKGSVFDITNFRKRWEAAVKEAGLTDFHFHDLRHTFASWARQNGADIADIKEALAHSSITTTMRYAHVRPDSETTAFDRVADLLSPRAKKKGKRA